MTAARAAALICHHLEPLQTVEDRFRRSPEGGAWGGGRRRGRGWSAGRGGGYYGEAGLTDKPHRNTKDTGVAQLGSCLTSVDPHRSIPVTIVFHLGSNSCCRLSANPVTTALRSAFGKPNLELTSAYGPIPPLQTYGGSSTRPVVTQRFPCGVTKQLSGCTPYV